MTMQTAQEITDIDADNDVDFISSGQQYLSFMLGSESYGVDILSVKEIRGWEDATLVPNSPDYVKGVVNLRGTIVPIIDLRIRFDIGSVDFSPTTVVIILSGKSETGDKTVGFIVDAVSDVLDVEDSDMKASPEFDGSVPAHYIHGLVNTNESVVTVLDIEHLLSMDK
ncbi:MAG: chemotaxis protein CheW [Cellvibrionaceae bacterium]